LQSVHEEAFAAVRATYSQLREADVQVERTGKRRDDAIRINETAITKRNDLRLELGRHLLRARVAWPERGPKAKGWGEFLEKEGIEQSTAWRYMEDAKAGSPQGDFMQDGRLHETPHPSELPDRSNAPGQPPSSRQPLALLADMQLLLGRWEDVLSKDEIGMVDVLISDTPYSERTHKSKQTRSDQYEVRGGGYNPGGIAPSYDHWRPEDVISFVESWSPRVRGWMACMTDSELMPVWRDAYERMGRQSFAPVPCVMLGMTVRLAGDGPSSWSAYLMVARPANREFSRWGTLPGAYVGPRSEESENGRGKPRWLMDAIVGDYSRDNDLVCDPCAGYGVTLVSALLKRRRAIGAEIDEDAVKKAFERANALNEEPTAA
jgi:hypothetical protein